MHERGERKMCIWLWCDHVHVAHRVCFSDCEIIEREQEPVLTKSSVYCFRYVLLPFAVAFIFRLFRVKAYILWKHRAICATHNAAQKRNERNSCSWLNKLNFCSNWKHTSETCLPWSPLQHAFVSYISLLCYTVFFFSCSLFACFVDACFFSSTGARETRLFPHWLPRQIN